MRRSGQFTVGIAIAVATIFGWSATASATWSLVAVDPDTGLVGGAMASCVSASVLGNPNEALVPLVLVPGSAAAVVQGSIEPTMPQEIRKLLDDGATPQQAIDLLLEDDVLAIGRQIAVVTGGPGAFVDDASSEAIPIDGAAFTGSGTEGAAADTVVVATEAGPVAVQGVLLADAKVVDDALNAFVDSRMAGVSLDRALVDGLVAGSLAGGDRRCDEQTALFAHVAVAEADDDGLRPSLALTVLVDSGDGQNPVTLLDTFLDEGRTGWIDVGQQDPAGAPRAVALVAAAVLGAVALFVMRAGMGNRSARR